jgi:hypothetical protein
MTNQTPRLYHGYWAEADGLLLTVAAIEVSFRYVLFEVSDEPI